jgi:50S ribosomal subunit-associated GTPase HflX
MEVYNKVDRAETMIRRKGAVGVSALTGKNVDKLAEAIRERELAGGEVVQLEIPHGEARLLAQLHDAGVIYEQKNNEEAAVVTAWLPRELLSAYQSFTVARDRYHEAM